jgi:hypothetical protein
LKFFLKAEDDSGAIWGTFGEPGEQKQVTTNVIRISQVVYKEHFSTRSSVDRAPVF